jgi:lipopolysaccharide/colanic/teichoic acid biosynthesis glycosyltransferase
MIYRFFDVFLSSVSLILLSPLFLIVCIVLRCTGEREVFFYQSRVGKKGKLFNLFKFATMLKDSPNLGTGTVTLKNDARVLPFGYYLRKSKINELPQLLNILKGDMSIIGPRPQTVRCFEAFPKAYQLKIITVKPGLSGIGSIIFRNEENLLNNSNSPSHFYDKVIMPFKGSLEDWYVSHLSIWTYFTLIFLTIWVVIFPKSKLVWRLFISLPKPPKDISKHI